MQEESIQPVIRDTVKAIGCFFTMKPWFHGYQGFVWGKSMLLCVPF